MTEADYVIVGAGSAGCVLADRLSVDGRSRVVLVEAGGPDSRPEIAIPAAYPRLFGSAVDWAFSTEEQIGLAGRPIYFPRGKTLGGCSSLNAQIWTRGHPADYDSWGPGWSFADVLPYFQRAEDRVGGPGVSGYGAGGPISVDDLRDPSPATAAFLAACAQAGHEPVGDAESSAGDGYGPVRVTHRNGRRWSAADAYLRPALDRANLSVVTGGHVQRVVLDAGRAVGVDVATEQGVQRIRATREVILAAGAVASPQLLMLSGIGDPEHLREVGVPVRVPLPEVGRNLADHLYVPLVVAAREPISPGVGDQRADAIEYFRTRRGKLSSNLAEALVFLRTDDAQPAPDVEIVWMLVPFLDHGRGDRGHGVTAGVVLLQPVSRGRVALRSGDPADAPAIDPRYLSDGGGDDLRVTVEGVRAAQRILAQPALESLLGEPLVAGALDGDAESIGRYIRDHAETLYHPVGTCRLGTDPDSVVDPEFRVRGVTGLRVVDASTMPSIPRAHTHAPTVMLAERAADLIRGAATVRPAVQRTPATLPTEKGRGEVAVYASEEQARKTFQELFTAVLADGDFASKLAERGLSLHFVQTDPAVELFVSADGVVLDKVPHPPTLRFELSTDTAHEMWLGKLPIPRAAIARRLAIKGPVARIRQLADLLPTVGATYGALLSQRGN